MTQATAQARMNRARNPSRRPQLTSRALQHVRDMLAASGNTNGHLRIAARAHGCSGLQYGFALEDRVGHADLEIGDGAASVLMDALSYQRMMGATIDCIAGPDGPQLVIENPNESGTGCADGACACSGGA